MNPAAGALVDVERDMPELLRHDIDLVRDPMKEVADAVAEIRELGDELRIAARRLREGQKACEQQGVKIKTDFKPHIAAALEALDAH